MTATATHNQTHDAGARPADAGPAPTTRALLARFRPVLDEIAAGAAARETSRTLAYDAVERLKRAGFTAVRVPASWGGGGATLSQTLLLLVELGAADSNLVQALRAHFTSVESLVSGADAERRARWLPRVVAGDIFGNATTEKGNAPGRNSTILSARDGAHRLDGTKFYSTGSLYADWIRVHADTEDGGSVRATVHRDAPGLELVDDWDGFGQRLTASGTTRLTGVPVETDNVEWSASGERPGFTASYVQAVLLAALVGIAKASRRDAIEYVLGRGRAFSHGVGDSPRRDPLVQEVVGRISSTVFALEAAFGAAALEVERVADASRHGPVDDPDVEELDTLVSEAQIFISEQTLDVANRLFEVGGASAASESRRLDRHWRNARVLAQHNPVMYRARAVGQQRLTGDHQTTPIFVGAAGRTQEQQA